MRRLQSNRGCVGCEHDDVALIVVSGHTFCTVETFSAVAKAVAECAFVTSELPVILSLEMHCSVKQQARAFILPLNKLRSSGVRCLGCGIHIL